MAYTNTQQISNYLQRSLTTQEVSFLSTLLPAIQLWLDRTLASHFDEVEATTRYYDGGNKSIDIDPCHTITEVASLNDDGTESYSYINNDEYIAYPMNETIKTELVRRTGSFNKGSRRIAVTAKFTEYIDRVPHDIMLAATRIAAEVLREGSTSAAANVQSESLEGHTVTYRNPNEIIDKIGTQDPFVVQLIESRKDILLG